MLAVINGARHTLSIENEEMGDSAITSAIVAAAERGVKVEVTMTADSEYDSDLSPIVRAGGHVHLYADSYDRTCTSTPRRPSRTPARATERIYLGSINFSSASMERNRELGVVTSSPTIVSQVNAVVAADFSLCRRGHRLSELLLKEPSASSARRQSTS